jgi:predicted phosphoribosyltransferase
MWWARERFADRAEGGRTLAGLLVEYADRDDVIVLGLPRGGVPVAAEVARALHAPLDVFVVRKLGVPGHEELAMGAIASGGVRVVDAVLIGRLGISEHAIEAVVAREASELGRRESAYRGERPPVELPGRTVLLVDDGLATGSSMRAAVVAVKRAGAARVVVAVPVAPPQAVESLRAIADDVIAARTPDPFDAVGLHYVDFNATSDDEVREALGEAD